MPHARTIGVLILTVVMRCGPGGPQTAKPPEGLHQPLRRQGSERLARAAAELRPGRGGEAVEGRTAAKQAEWNTARDPHWKVDTAKGEIVSDGQSPHLATGKDYGDFEFYVDWLMVSPNGDSGVYLRGYPQVQVWDPDNPREVKNGAPKGSGALWNDNADNPGKWPLVKADNPVGQWNTFKIKMIGSRVWVSLNDKVDGRRPGARQLLRPQDAADRGPRSDRAADARLRDPLPEHLHPRDSSCRSESHAQQASVEELSD